MDGWLDCRVGGWRAGQREGGLPARSAHGAEAEQPADTPPVGRWAQLRGAPPAVNSCCKRTAVASGHHPGPVSGWFHRPPEVPSPLVAVTPRPLPQGLAPTNLPSVPGSALWPWQGSGAARHVAFVAAPAVWWYRVALRPSSRSSVAERAHVLPRRPSVDTGRVQRPRDQCSVTPARCPCVHGWFCSLRREWPGHRLRLHVTF